MAYFESPITEQPLLGSAQLASIAGGMSAPTTGPMPTAAMPGTMIGGGAQDYLNQMFQSDMGQSNAANLVKFQNQYDPAASALAFSQQQANSQLGNQANQYELAQQQSGINRTNAGRQQGMNNLDFLNNLLGGLF